MKTAILRFQQNLLLPALGETPTKILQQDQWMGFGGAGLGWGDLNEKDANELAQWLGPSAFKVIRISPDLLDVIRRPGPKVVAGGSCLVTTADNSLLNKGQLAIEDLPARLPNFAQLLDPLLPIRGATLHLNILEDTLFAQRREHLLGAFQAQGCRHTTMLARWVALHEASAPVHPCWFSGLPVQEATNAFYSGAFFRGQIPRGISRAQVEFSFTGAWADLLRTQKAIPQDADYLVVEPYHHFTETMCPATGLPGSSVHRMLAGNKRFFESFPYGQGLNQGIAGGIAFVPYLEPNGELGFKHTSSDMTCHQQNVEAFLLSREQILATMRVPPLASDRLFTDGLNALYVFPECLEALYGIRALWDTIEQECAGLSHDRPAAKLLRDKLRASSTVLELWRPNQEVLLRHLKELILSVFSPLAMRLAS